MLAGFGFPNPVEWAADEVAKFATGTASAGFGGVVAGLTAWVLDAVVWVVGGVFQFFLGATDPNVQADWFTTGHGPYRMTATIGATLLVGFVLAGIAQGVFSGDVGGMARQVAFHLPLSVLGMVGLVSVTQALVVLTDALSRALLERFEADTSAFVQAVTSLSNLSGSNSTALVVFLLALVAVVAGLVLVAELIIRSALIYIVVALAPLVLAANVWPALRGAGKRLLELLAALVLSKLVIAVALAVASAAAVGSGSGGRVTALPAPEAVAVETGGSVTQAVGILLAAAAAFGVAAFSPMLIAKLLPLTEQAVVAQGVRGGPMRAGQQAASVGLQARAVSNHRLGRVAGGSQAASASVLPAGAGAPPSAAGAGAGGGSAGAAGAGAAAAAGPAAVAAIGAAAVQAGGRAAGKGVRAGTSVADRDTPAPSLNPPGKRRSPGSGR